MATAAPSVLHLSLVVGGELRDGSGERLGRVDDLIVRLRDGGLSAPVTLFFLWRLSRNEELMGEYRNGRVFDAVAAVTVLATSALSLALVALTLAGKA
jgi:hypothetical protein